MKSNNYLVTYDELATMGLIKKSGTIAPTGQFCATKDYINTYYHAEPTALAGYADNQLPPYQAILPATTPYLLCYNQTITNTTVYDGCGNPQSAENWTITLLDQFGNYYTTPTNQIFTVAYDYVWQSDIPPYYESYIQTSNIVVLAGNYQGFAQFISYYVEACPYSSSCSGECYNSISNVNLINTPPINGGCSLPPTPPTPGTTTYLVPNAFIPDSSNPANNVVRIYKVVNGSGTELVYSNYPNMSWQFQGRSGSSVYSGNNSVYVPWNGRLNNTGPGLESDAYAYAFELNDGSGTRITGAILLLR
jgi:hypothetical protein